MRNIFSCIVITLICVITSGCASVGQSQNYGLNFNDVMNVNLGADKNLLLKKFGQPNRIESRELNSSVEQWVYQFKNNNHLPRAVFFIDKTSDQLSGKAFMFLNEPDNRLAFILSKFSGVDFVQERRKQTSHYIPNEIVYSNEAHGIFMVINDARQEVESISWLDRNLSSYMASHIKR